MKRFILSLAFVLSWLAGNSLAQSIGEPEESVLQTLGEPSMSRDSGTRKIWMYPDGTKVVFEGGVVVETTAAARAPRSVAPSREVEREQPAPRRQVSSAQPERSVRSRARQNRAVGRPHFTGPAAFFFVVGMLVILICNVVYIVAAFAESVLWGLAVIFVPFASLVFLFLHWDRVKKPFLVALLVGTPMLIIALVMQAGAEGL